MSYFELKDNFKKISGVKSILIKGSEEMEREPRISVAIPTYNRPELLKVALDSVLGQKNFNDYEVVIVDNNTQPVNDTEILLRQYEDKRIRYYKNEQNLGMTSNWNRAIELCRGEYITILHDDDALFPQFLSSMNKALCKYDPDLLSCYCRFGEQLEFPDNDKARTYRVHEIRQSKCLLTNITPFPGVLFKKSCALALGGFNEELFPIADYVFWTNCCLRYNCFVLDGILAFYRKGAVSTSSKVYIDIVKKSLDFREELSRKINLPRFVKWLLQDVGIRVLISGYMNYGSINNITKETGYKAVGINCWIVRKAYGAAFKALNKLYGFV